MKTAFIPALLSSFNAQYFALGRSLQKPNTPYHGFVLTPDSPYATLDYGAEVAGFPTLEITNIDGPTQIEVKYSEQLSGLAEPFSDGPSLFVASLANSFRVETFNITSAGNLSSKLLQGGPTLAKYSLAYSEHGRNSISSSVGAVDTDNLPGSFHSSNKLYNEIWSLGARAVSLSCFDAGSQKPTMEVSAQGSKVSSSLPNYSSLTYNFTEYDMEFDAKIARGGFIWSVGYNFGIRSSGGILINLAGKYPEETTYVNTNKTLFPPSTITLAHGVSFVNQTTLTSYKLASFKVPFDLEESLWHRISTSVRSNHLAVSVNQTQLFNVSLSSYYVGGSSISTSGAFGFGAWQDQSAYIRGVYARDTTGNMIYHNSMTNAALVLPEYGQHENYFPTCVDGAKRDRLAWLGDFLHTTRIIGVTTNRSDHITGTFKLLLSGQLSSGQLPMAPSLGYSPDIAPKTFAVSGIAYLLPDYQILALISFVSYMEHTNDTAFACEHWIAWKAAVQWLAEYRDESTGLIDFSQFGNAFLGPSSGSAVNAASIEAFKGMASVASAIGDASSANKWATIYKSLQATLNAHLWSEEYGVYSIQESQPGNFSISALGFAITSGSANATQINLALSKLHSLKLGPGYRDSSLVASSDLDANLSPNTNGFLLPALLQQKQAAPAKFLLNNLWGAMVSNDTTKSGSTWEYVNQKSQPGYGQFTSLSHPWGGAATYALTNYVAGIRPVSFGYKSWIVEPAYAGFGLDEVSATVPTPHGPLSVAWTVRSSVVTVTIDAPAGTTGKLVLSQGWACQGEFASQNCDKIKDFVHEIQSGGLHHFTHSVRA
ncbi:hypothetical protein N7509_008383 [Penicillium cosmopolitanum]|uniref:Alpha-L-rhamnosidase six-hairpin glycosidase domain-containing protein n=1 Tax=Penicillium cosmopolitanum TaxID=1131564 RepID=A0A9W9VMI3_9EURO|nr:uncharacterized protein N7509_008383 [Penicillium cosmopolitanum]KAJ5385842.1 hypothetical protein N7509_008383 [Penicillium cosmopolitanum]